MTKDYLGFENARNKRNAHAYTRLIQAAFTPAEGQCAVLIGHHLTFELNGDLETENEIPSADCLMFDHDVMVKVFGKAHAYQFMVELALLPCAERDEHLGKILDTFLTGVAA